MVTLAPWRVALIALATFGSAATSLAQSGPGSACDGPELVAVGVLAPEWRASLDDIRLHLAALPEVDRCARVELISEAEQVKVQIRLADGRVALRSVATPVEATTVVEALLTPLPGRQALPREAAPATPRARPENGVPRSRPTTRVVEIDVGVGASARVAGRPWFLSYGLAGHASVAINNWLLGSWVRWDIQDRLVEGREPRSFISYSFLLGAFTGRRISLPHAELDFLVGPNLLVETEEAAGTDGDDVGGELGSLSLGAGLRVLAPRHGSPAFLGMCTGDVIPSRLSHRQRADPSLPSLPAWSGTLVLGLVWAGL